MKPASISVLAGLALLFPCGAGSAGEMIRLDGGSFMMGSDNGPADERPRHGVTVRAFLMEKTAVTNEQFAQYLNKQGWVPPRGGVRRFDLGDSDARIVRTQFGKFIAVAGHEKEPVVEVSWIGAREYCAAMGMRLPTEAEWEFAAKGTAGRLYPWGEGRPSAERAQFGQKWGKMAAVDAHPKGATPAGVLGLAGNQHEWTSSAYRPYPYLVDESRQKVDYRVERVTRGGAHDSPGNHLVTTWRGAGVSREPKAGHHNIGFRCAKSVTE